MTTSKHLKFNAVRYKSVDSTNQKATELLADGVAHHGTVVTANVQTAGKGQRGNKWSSESGTNLLASFILKPNHVKAENQFILSVVTALAVQHTVGKLLGNKTEAVKIKWPNDILIGTKKVSGILIENALLGAGISSSIMGIGINVNQTTFEELPHATSLAMQKGSEFELDRVLDELSTNLAAFYALVGRDEKLLMELFREHMFGLHCWLNLSINETEDEYRILGIEYDGRLKVEDRSFRTYSVQHHEVMWMDFQ